MQSGVSKQLICASIKTFATFYITLSIYIFRSFPKSKPTMILNKVHRGMTPSYNRLVIAGVCFYLALDVFYCGQGYHLGGML